MTEEMMKSGGRQIAAMLALLANLGIAHAASYTVTSLNDSGDGSLRAAITAANASGGVDDTIAFTSSGKITLLTPLPLIADNLTLDGSGHSITISGGSRVPVLEVAAGKSLKLNALTIADGRPLVAKAGGGVIVSVGARLEVQNCTFSNNVSYSNNRADHDLGGSAIYDHGGTVIVSDSLFSFNSTSLDGGAIHTKGSATITRSTFENNYAYFASGAIHSTGSLNVSNSTFVRNSARVNSGTVYVAESGTIVNSTFYSNSSMYGSGAIGTGGGAPGSAVIVINSTFYANNSALNRGALGASSNNVVKIQNSVLANNTGGSCYGQVLDSGGNLSDDFTCTFITGTSLAGTLPQLGPLQNNGGPTQTMAPLVGSPAIDQGVNSLAVDANGQALTTDQRGPGFSRFSGVAVDRGAVELQVPTPTSLTAWPGALTFEAVPRFSLRVKWLTLKNNGASSVTLNRISVTPEPGTKVGEFTAISSCPSRLAVGQSCTIYVALFSYDLGSRAAKLIIPSSAVGSPVTLPLRATVTPISSR